MCLQKQGEKLYTNVRQTVAQHLQNQISAITKHDGDQFLAVMQRFWRDYKLSIALVRDVCLYLDRTWVEQAKMLPVFEMGLELFRDLVVRDERVRMRLLPTMLGYVERERNGEMIPRDVAKAVIDIWWDISPRRARRPSESSGVSAASSPLDSPRRISTVWMTYSGTDSKICC